MTKIINKNLIRFSLVLGLVASFTFGFLFFKIYSIKAQEQIKILPAAYSGSWQNQESVASQDLGTESGFSDFNVGNSAYVDLAVLDPNSTELNSFLDLSDFSVSEDLKSADVDSVKLALSLAAKGGAGDRLVIDYFQDSWKNLADLSLDNEISNSLNSGYFTYNISGFQILDDLKNLKIRVSYIGQQKEEGSQASEIYLDAAWLDIEFSQQTSVVETIKSILIFKLEQQPESFNIFKSQEKYYLDESNEDLSGAIVNEIKISWVAEYSYQGEKSVLYEKELDWAWQKTENGLSGTTDRYSCPITLEYSFLENSLNVKTSVTNKVDFPVENLTYRFIVKYSPDFSLDNSNFTLNKGEERVQFNVGSDVLSKSLEKISDGQAEISIFVGTVNPGDKSEININLF